MFTAGFSNSVVHCLHQAVADGLVSWTYVLDGDSTASKGARRMVAELQSRGVPASLLPTRELAPRLSRRAVIVLGFEAVTPAAEVVDPDQTLDCFRERPGIPLYLAGEAFKIIDLTDEMRLQFQRKICQLEGEGALALKSDVNVWRIGRFEQHLRGIMATWRNKLRGSLNSLELVAPDSGRRFSIPRQLGRSGSTQEMPAVDEEPADYVILRFAPDSGRARLVRRAS